MYPDFSDSIEKFFTGDIFSLRANSLIGFNDAKKTKIVATIGPATESEEQLTALMKAGMNVARFNTKHNEPQWHFQIIERVRKVAAGLSLPVGILLDLQGPEIRVTVANESFEVNKGEHIYFSDDLHFPQQKVAQIPTHVIESLNTGNHIIVGDGTCEFIVIEKGENFLRAEAIDVCVVKTRKTMNTPNVVLNMPSLLARDLEYLEAVKEVGIEFVALSFVRDQQDIFILRQELQKRNINCDIVAKIENQKALDNLERIIQVSDSIMVARGDLAVEVDYVELAYWQKKIIALCRKAGKPVITATQMLYSMTENPRPTRAEICDVANSVYDGTDAVMLSEETTNGKFPVKTVEVQNRIVSFYEKHTNPSSLEESKDSELSVAAQSAIDLLTQHNQNLQKIVLVCDNTDFVHLLAKFRLSIPIFAITTTLNIAQKLSLCYGVFPFFIPHIKLTSLPMDELVEFLKRHQKISVGEKVLFIYNLSQQEESTSSTQFIREV
jgi:pyruvate kinase